MPRNRPERAATKLRSAVRHLKRHIKGFAPVGGLLRHHRHFVDYPPLVSAWGEAMKALIIEFFPVPVLAFR